MIASAVQPLHAKCVRCGASVVDELCYACAVAAALPDGGERIGPYTLLSELDAGGTCTVHVARREGQDGLFALKLAKESLVQSAEGLAAYRSGLRIQKSLSRQPNILSLEEIGTHTDGRPYAVMALLDGGTLADRGVHARYLQPEAALTLMVKLTRAVARAHQRGVLHADLKPDNILFDEDHEPFISDFGLARVLGDRAGRAGASFQGGTSGWMSPEQSACAELTLASDVFSLGVLLYWLLTDQLPFGSGLEYLRRVREQPTPALALSYQGPHAFELDQICQRALHKNPEQRYRSAAELADELERVLTWRPIESERQRPVRRAWKWCQRHKLAAFLLIQLVCSSLLYLHALPLLALEELRATTRMQLGFSALAQAGAVMNELRATADRLARVAREPELVRLIAQHGDPRLAPASLGPLARGGDGLSLFSAEGLLRARWPKHRVSPPTRIDYSFRDYHRGAVRVARAGLSHVYVARPFLSTGDDVPVLGLSTPIYEGERFVGVVVASTRAGATFGSLSLDCGGERSCSSALLGSRDRDVPEQALPDSLFVLAAPGLASGQEVTLDAPLTRRICARLACTPQGHAQFEPPMHREPLLLEDYVDPLSHTPALAAFAPVGRTGLIVMVETPHDALSAIAGRMTRHVLSYLWLPISLGLALFFALLLAPRWYARLKSVFLRADR